MHRLTHTALAVLLFLSTALLVAAPQAKVGPIQTSTDFSRFQPRILGTGGAYFLVPKGRFTLTFQKMDMRKGVAQTVRFTLFDPARNVLADVWLPGTGKPGQFQQVDLACEVAHPGVYGFMISAPDDRYGQNFRWGFQTNCAKFLVETSRGHRDARHQETVGVATPEIPGDIFFYPPKQAFGLELGALPRKTPPPTLLDDQGKTVAAFKLEKDKPATCHVPASPARRAPWAVHFPKMQAVVSGDHFSRWDADSLFPNSVLWTWKRSAWFDYHTNRHLLFPHNFQRNIPAGQKAEAVFLMKNPGDQPKTVKLALEFAPGDQPFATLPRTSVTLPPRCKGHRLAVTLVSKRDATCRLRATADGFTTYSTITVRQAPEDRDYRLKLPVALTPYRHENQFAAYAPDYPVDGQPYFDLENRPFILGGNTVFSLHDGKWIRAVFDLPGDKKPAISFAISKIAFDKDNWAYTIVNYRNKKHLAYSSDRGRTFRLAILPVQGSGDIEVFTGHNLPPGPPPVTIFQLTESGADVWATRWRRISTMSLAIPEKRDGAIRFGKTLTVSKNSFAPALHSGCPCTIASFQGKTHLIWGEATDPADKSIPGVPTYVATYDHATGTLSRPVLVGHGAPANDIHNTPCLTIDGQGYLHALVGTHGATFQYARSLKPNTTQGGWTRAAPVGNKLSQTYIGMVCDQDNLIHTAFRLWNGRHPLLQKRVVGTLSRQTKPAAADQWPSPAVFLYAPFTDYSVFYHRLTIDRKGALYLSYTYWSTYWFYRSENPADRALARSADGGRTWSLVSKFE